MKRSSSLAALADVAGVLVFAAIGRRSHAEGLTVAGVAATAWPFLVGTAVGWLLVRGWRRPAAIAPTGLVVWVCTVVIGMLARRATSAGVAVSFDDVVAIADGGAIGRPHVARAMVASGWAADLRDAFDRYLGAGKPAYVAKDQLSMSDAIAMIHEAGGLAVLAHPGWAGTRERIEALTALGLDGVEVKHPGHSSSDTQRLKGLVELLGLVPSGGSDWHGAAEGARTIGMMQVPSEWLALQDARVAVRAGAGTPGD